jgi:hypothetical protein
MTHRRPFWLVWRSVALGGILLALIGFAYAFFTPDKDDDLLVPSIVLLTLFALGMLFLFAVVFTIAAARLRDVYESLPEDDLPLQREFADHLPSRGELTRLLRLKRRGTLLTRSSRVRERASRTAHTTPDAGRLSEPRWHQAGSGGNVLDRLMWLKNVGAWKRRTPETE